MNAEIRHRAGMSCKNVAAYNEVIDLMADLGWPLDPWQAWIIERGLGQDCDANGPGRWRVDCGAPLGSDLLDKPRFDPFIWVIVLLSSAGLLMVALLVWAWTGGLDGA